MKAFDQIPGTSWATAGQRTGSWIRADFSDTMILDAFEYQNRDTAGRDANRGVTLSFSQGPNQDFEIPQTLLQRFQLSPTVVTTFVQITVNTVRRNVGTSNYQTFLCFLPCWRLLVCASRCTVMATMGQPQSTSTAPQVSLRRFFLTLKTTLSACSGHDT